MITMDGYSGVSEIHYLRVRAVHLRDLRQQLHGCGSILHHAITVRIAQSQGTQPVRVLLIR